MTPTTRVLVWPAAALVGAALFLSSAIAVFAASVTHTGGSTPGSVLSVSGSGFQSGEPVQLMMGLSTGSAAADGSGSFSAAPLTIPNVSSGTYIIIAVGQNSGLVAFNYIYVSSFIPNASPSSWWIAPGSTLTWSGTGFAPNESITLARNGTTLTTFAAGADGSFSAAAPSVIPFALANTTATFSLAGSSGTQTYLIGVSSLYPFASPSSWYTLPGSTVTFTGGGFGAGENIRVFLGTDPSPVAQFNVNSSGAFTNQGSVVIPFGTGAAVYRLVGDESGAEIVLPITRAGFYPSLTPSSYYSAPGGLISLAGTGFAANEQVEVTIGGATHTPTTDSMGAFTLPSVQAPSTPNTPATVSAEGQSSGAATSFTMAIGQYYPDIIPSFWFSYPGDTITFSGAGFAPNETITISGAGSGTVSTDSVGAFSGYSAVLPTSNATYTFTGSSSITPFSITIALGERFAGIWFNNYWGVGGSPLTVFGAGFGNGEQVAISHGGTTFTTASAASDGSFTHLTAMPFAPAGPLVITATGANTGATASAGTNVAPIWPTLQFGSYAVAPGNTLNIIGSGYLANEPMEVVVDGTVVGTFSADGSGSFNNSSVVLPTLPEGLHDIVVRGTHSFHSSTVTIWVLGS